MKPYETYKDSGIEWIGEIPSHWDVKRFKYLFSFVNDKCELDLPKIGLEHIESWTGRKIENNTEFEGEGVCFQKGDILFGKLRPYLAKVYLADFVGKAVGDFFVFRPQANMNKAFGHKFLLCRNFIEITNSSTFGSKMPRVSPDFINELKSILPPLAEQTTISNYLHRKTVEIDSLIANKKLLLQLHEEEKTAIISQAVTNGINPKAKMKDSGVEWLGEIPDHWEAVNLKWVSKIYSGGTPSKNIEDYWQNGTIPWLNSGTVNQFYITEPSEFITEDALNNSSAKWIPENSLVIALAGQGKTKGMAAQVMFKSTCNQSMGVILPNELIENRFLLYYLVRNYQNIRNLGGGDKRDGINLEMVGGIFIPLLPITEQQSIVRHIETECAQIDAKIDKTKKLIELLTEYRTALISEVVTGKIKVID